MRIDNPVPIRLLQCKDSRIDMSEAICRQISDNQTYHAAISNNR